jgi:Tfp pilus assembly protein PilF
MTYPTVFDPQSATHSRASALRRIAAAWLLVAMAACGKTAGNQPAADPDAQLMQRGVTLLYQGGDPIGAEAVFRQVLQQNPNHYGAQYQLAVAIDRGGRPAEARPVWEKVLANSVAAHDTATERTARARIAAPDTASEAAMMSLGLDLLYRQNNASLAADQFRKVLARNPTHYGATYQLATSLDRIGRRVEARGLWVKVLGMAETYKDQKTAETARARLR